MTTRITYRRIVRFREWVICAYVVTVRFTVPVVTGPTGRDAQTTQRRTDRRLTPGRRSRGDVVGLVV